MKKNEQIEFVSSAEVKINHIHYPVSLLQQVQSLLPLLSFNKLNGRVIQFSQDNRYLVLWDAKFFVVMFIKRIVLVESPSLWPVILGIAVASLWRRFLNSALIPWPHRRPISLSPINRINIHYSYRFGGRFDCFLWDDAVWDCWAEEGAKMFAEVVDGLFSMDNEEVFLLLNFN